MGPQLSLFPLNTRLCLAAEFEPHDVWIMPSYHRPKPLGALRNRCTLYSSNYQVINTSSVLLFSQIAYGFSFCEFPCSDVLQFCRDVDLTEKLDYSSAVALLGFSLILAVLRVFSVTDEAARVMVSAPLVAFVTTHILYLNCYQLDYGMPTSQLLDIGYCMLVINCALYNLLLIEK